MKNVQVRNVPERVHKVLRRRAAEAGQSLQEYLLQLLDESASRPTMKEWVERVSKHATGRWGPGEAARIIREERDARERHLASLVLRELPKDGPPEFDSPSPS